MTYKDHKSIMEQSDLAQAHGGIETPNVLRGDLLLSFILTTTNMIFITIRTQVKM